MRILWSLTLAICCCLAARVAEAADLQSLRTLEVEPGRISDAAQDGTGRIYLCYPDAGYVAQYGPDGQLAQLIRREAGVERQFRPTSCIVGTKELLHVFDEISREVLVISPDGNQQRSFPLAYPVDGTPLALSRIGHLLPYSDGVWTLLPDRGELARFDGRGVMKEKLALSILLPYPVGSYSRAQFIEDGTLFILDYNQGAVLYRSPQLANFKRLSLQRAEGIDAVSLAQDFAADSRGNILLLATGLKPEAALLARTKTGYTSSALALPAKLSGKRLGCRPAGRGFVVWAREGGIVWLCAVR